MSVCVLGCVPMMLFLGMETENNQTPTLVLLAIVMVFASLIGVYVIVDAIFAILGGNLIVSILAAITAVIIIAAWVCFYESVRNNDV